MSGDVVSAGDSPGGFVPIDGYFRLDDAGRPVFVARFGHVEVVMSYAALTRWAQLNGNAALSVSLAEVCQALRFVDRWRMGAPPPPEVTGDGSSVEPAAELRERIRERLEKRFVEMCVRHGGTSALKGELETFGAVRAHLDQLAFHMAVVEQVARDFRSGIAAVQHVMERCAKYRYDPFAQFDLRCIEGSVPLLAGEFEEKVSAFETDCLPVVSLLRDWENAKTRLVDRRKEVQAVEVRWREVFREWQAFSVSRAVVLPLRLIRKTARRFTRDYRRGQAWRWTASKTVRPG